jgi:ribosome biogenesis GTPase
MKQKELPSSMKFARHNYINRQSPRFKHQHHIVAANLDQSILVATLKEPKTSQGFIDRFLVACEMYHVSAFIVFNKSDLYKTKELKSMNNGKPCMKPWDIKYCW